MRQMKILILTTAFLAFNQSICLAQNEISLIEIKVPETYKPSEETVDVESAGLAREVYFQETRLAQEQLIEYLDAYVSYPENMKTNGIEGELVTEIQFSKAGEILSVSIYKSLHKEFDQIVIKAIEEMQQLELADDFYLGARKIRIPINFSLR